MIGTIIGDIVGSVYEFNNIKTKQFEFFNPKAEFTDDSIMAIAVAEAILNSHDFEDEDAVRAHMVYSMLRLGNKYPYPMGGYGSRFVQWLRSNDPKPYGSYGNGSAMRVAACGFAGGTLKDALTLAQCSAEVTHNHPDGIRGAQCVAACIWLAKDGYDKDLISEIVNALYYPLNKNLDQIRLTYKFESGCQGTVPQAIQAFLESTDFEDAIRNAVSLGGDSDTLAAITGGIAEAYYGVPDDIRARAEAYLAPDLLEIVKRFEKKYQ